MAISGIYGFEGGHAYAEAYAPPGSGNNTPSIGTSVVHGGTYAMRCTGSGSSTANSIALRSIPAGGVLRKPFQSVQFYLRIDTLPSSNTIIFRTYDSLGSTTNARIMLNTGGTFTIGTTGGTDLVTSTNALSADALWHKIEFDVGWNSGSGRRLYVDDVEWASSSANAEAVHETAEIGIITFSTTTADLYFDDVVLHDAALGSYLGAAGWKILALMPIADSSLGGWTGGAAGTTNLWDAVDNKPPVGVASGSGTNTSQIKNAVNATNQDYTATMQSYTTGGLVASDTVNAVMAVCNHGEGVSTGTKAGGIWVASNPAQAAGGQTFDFGDDVGAAGTYPANWRSAASTVEVSPSVTLGTQPTVTVRKTPATTRTAEVDYLALNVMYTPAGTPVLAPRLIKNAVYRM